LLTVNIVTHKDFSAWIQLAVTGISGND